MLNSCKILSITVMSIVGLSSAVTTTVHADSVPVFAAMPAPPPHISAVEPATSLLAGQLDSKNQDRLLVASSATPGAAPYQTVSSPTSAYTQNFDEGIEIQTATKNIDNGIEAKCQTYKIDPGIETIQPVAITKPEGVLSPDIFKRLPKLKGGQETP